MYTKIVNFIYELGVLKILPRSGSFFAGVKSPDTVGMHVFRASQLAFILAELEGGNGQHTCFLVNIHDNAEARIGDLNKVNSRYITNKKEIEKQAFFDQIKSLPESIQLNYQQAYLEMDEMKTLESKCARDADLLELAFEAAQLLEQGYTAKKSWISSIEKGISTQSAKNIFQELQNINSYDWWTDLKK